MQKKIRTLLKIKNNIQKIRKDRGLSQAGLSKVSGIPKTTIIALENGKLWSPSDPTVLSLCQALNAKKEDIFYL